jgi:hypothetical protein
MMRSGRLGRLDGCFGADIIIYGTEQPDHAGIIGTGILKIETVPVRALFQIDESISDRPRKS